MKNLILAVLFILFFAVSLSAQNRQNLPEPVQTEYGVEASKYEIAGVQVFLGDTTAIRCILSLFANGEANANIGFMSADVQLTEQQKQAFLEIFTPILQATLQQGGGTGQGTRKKE